MPRGRVITPDFWTDETIIGLSPFARLLYLGMWNFAYCDSGHLPDEPLGLKLKILPNDAVSHVELMAELMSAGRVSRLIAGDGKTFLWMPSFERHQKKDERWKTRCPACAQQTTLNPAETQESLGELTETHPSSALREEKRTREKKAFVQDKPAPQLDFEFAEWWQVYPRKQGKTAAFKAFTKARKTVTHEALMLGVRSYALLSIGREREFLKLPAGWLNDGRYDDELTDVQPTRSGTATPGTCMHDYPSGECPYCAEGQVF